MDAFSRDIHPRSGVLDARPVPRSKCLVYSRLLSIQARLVWLELFGGNAPCLAVFNMCTDVLLGQVFQALVVVHVLTKAKTKWLVDLVLNIYVRF